MAAEHLGEERAPAAADIDDLREAREVVVLGDGAGRGAGDADYAAVEAPALVSVRGALVPRVRVEAQTPTGPAASDALHQATPVSPEVLGASQAVHPAREPGASVRRPSRSGVRANPECASSSSTPAAVR